MNENLEQKVDEKIKEKTKGNFLHYTPEYWDSLTKMEKFKLPIIFAGNIVFAFAFFALGCFLCYEAFAAWKNFIPVGILCLLSSIIYITAIVLLKKQKLYTAAMLSSIGILMITMIILDICPASVNSLVYYRSGCFLAVMSVCNQVVALKRSQIKIFIYAALVMWIVMIVRTVPVTGVDMVQTISSIAINSLGVFICILLVSAINRFNIETLESQISAEQDAQKNFSQITQVLEDSKTGLSVGQKLVEETQKAGSDIEHMNSIYSHITVDTANLSYHADTINTSSSQVLTQAQQMQNTISSQNNLINQTSDALIAISNNISSLSNLAEQRSSNMQEMLKAFSSEKTLVKKIVEQVQQVQESSDGIAGFVKTVNTIASQTNLLAMNASIEASHAGVVGKGFSVIAHEIRSLSEQTSKNAAQINDELSKNAELVTATTQSVQSFESYIQKTTEDMGSTIQMIEQLISGIQSIDTENSKVMESLKTVVTSSKETNVLADDVVQKITDQDEALTKITNLAQSLKQNVDQMSVQLQGVSNAINAIDSEAKENISVSQKINQYLG